jgi:ribosomal protein L37AE/L43A
MVKQISIVSLGFQIAKEVTMSAVAEVLSTVSHNSRGSDRPTCPVCADSMVAAEASAYLADNIVSHLWTCDTCGYGFVTKHTLKRMVCN